MPSFDIVNRITGHELDNAIQNARKQIGNRYDFRGSPFEIDWNPKDKIIRISAADTLKLKAIGEVIQTCAAQRKIDLKALHFEDAEPGAGASLKQVIRVKEGLDHDLGRDIVKRIKDSKLKVQASIQGDEVRVSGKKIDDLQAVIRMLKAADLPVPLQFVNMKS